MKRQTRKDEWRLCYRCIWKRLGWRQRFFLIVHWFGKHHFVTVEGTDYSYCTLCLKEPNER